MPTADARLTETHRLAQLRLGAITVRQMLTAFRALDPEDLDGSFADWLLLVTGIVQGARTQSSSLAAGYLSTFRALTLGLQDRFQPVLAAPADRRALTTSMLVTGPISIRSSLGRKVPLAAALDIAQERTAAAGMRHALAGGRETLTKTAQADPRMAGWKRITSGNACDFCAMLASRGGVYGEDSVQFEAHDRCGCTGEPIYR